MRASPSLTRRRWLAATTLTLANGAARADRPLLRASDQKGGLHALPDAAGHVAGLSYGIKRVYPAAAPLAEALNGDTVGVAPRAWSATPADQYSPGPW